MAANKLQWRRIAKGDKLPCQSFLRKKNGEILKLSTGAGVTVGQDAYYLPVDDVINVIKDYPVEESEDEKIRKEIIDFVKSRGGFKGDWIAWLEKQEEHQDYPKDVIDNAISFLANRNDGMPEEEAKDIVNAIITVLNPSYWPKQGEQKPVAWSEEDIKTIERIVCILDGIRYYNTVDNKQEKPYQSKIGWLESFKDRVLLQPKQEWKQENTDDLTDFENVMMHIGDSFFGDNAGLDPNDTNAIKEQANILLELVPKQEWSEEDKEMRMKVLKYLSTRCNVFEYEEVDNWLKSLRPQSQWKPSDEQITVLHDVAAYIDNSTYPKKKMF